MIPKLLILLFILLNITINSYSKDIIIDPGHSPNKPGAISCTGEKEYIYNDKLADFLQDELTQNGISSQKTRNNNQNISLINRVKNSQDKQLFISLHHDSVQPQFIQYINSKPNSNKDKGYSIFVSRKNNFINESIQYAKNISQYLYDNGLRPSKHHGENINGENREAVDEKLGIYYFDDLVVVKNAKCPAILLEAGVIVNPEDEKLVNTDNYKKLISRAIANAISIGEK